MSALSEAVQNTRKIIIGFVIFSIIVIVAQAILGNVQPPADPPVTNTNYYMPSINNGINFISFKPNSLITTNTNPAEYVKVGDFPGYAESIKVYNIKEKKVDLASIENAVKIASTLKLNENYERVGTNIYRWKDNQNVLSLEFNRDDYSIKIGKDFFNAAANPIKKPINNETIINNARNILGQVGLYKMILTDLKEARVDYVTVGQDRKLQSTLIPENAQLVRVTFYKVYSSADLIEQFRNQFKAEGTAYFKAITTRQNNVPPPLNADVRKPEAIEGSVTIYLNGDGSKLTDIVSLNYVPYELLPNPEVYRVISINQAFEKIKLGPSSGAYLAYLQKKESNLFESYTPLSIRKFNIDAAKTRLVYIEPNNWDHLDPSKPWTAYLYPFFWFEGVAQLENNDQADFVFLVDAIMK